MQTFGDFPEHYKTEENAKVLIQPVSYDGTSTWIKGASEGPQAILDASHYLEWYDIETTSEPFKNGIFTDDIIYPDSSPEQMVKEIQTNTKHWLNKRKFVITIGGEHSVSIGAINAYHEFYKNLTVVQIDAHADLRDSYFGSRYNHACVMSRVKDSCPIIQIGIRSIDKSEKEYMDMTRVFWAKDIYNSLNWINELKPLLHNNVYITIDLDGLDPSIMPSTGTPEPGGLNWYQIVSIIKNINILFFY